MHMKYKLIYFITVLSVSSLHAQTLLQSKVVDSKSKEPLAYAHIYNLSNQKGTISNEFGDFAIASQENDSIRISYLGYSEKIILANKLKNDTINLNAIPNLLNEITITPTTDDLFLMLHKSRDQLLQEQESINAKAYFFVNTTEDDNPIEFTQIFYNTTLKHGSIEEITFKTGDSYLNSNSQNGWFLNVNMSKAFSIYNITKNNKSQPFNPYQLSKRKLRKNYNLEELEYNSKYIKIKFTPKKNKTNHFGGIVWVDSRNYSLIKLQIEGDNSNGFFEPIGNSSIEELNYKIKYNYKKDDDRNQLSFISLSYESKIANKNKPRLIRTEGILHITKYQDSYFNPVFSFIQDVSDYRLISLVPDTKIFNYLTKDGHILLSEKQLDNLKLLKSSGVRFNSSEFGDDLFLNNYVKWSRERIHLKKTPKKVSVNKPSSLSTNGIKGINDQINQYQFKVDLLNVDPKIYLDLQQTNDGVIVETICVIDVYNSFNHLDDNPQLQAYVNIYFDLVEIYRRQFVKLVNQEKGNNIEDIKIKFDTVLLKIEEDLSQLRSDSFAGNNILELKKWNDIIVSELGINNFELVGITMKP